jgi:hypothetical protein
MDLYKFHEKPEQLHGHDTADETVPERIFKKYEDFPYKADFITREEKQALGRSANYSYKFALLTKKRFPEGEKAISTDPGLSTMYAYRIVKKRWPEGEAAILTSPMYAEQYARAVIKKPWPEGEKIIASTADSAYDYAKYTIGKRWPPGEAAILKDSISIKWYAMFLLKKRWPEGEKVLKKDKNNWREWSEYCGFFNIDEEEM